MSTRHDGYIEIGSRDVSHFTASGSTIAEAR